MPVRLITGPPGAGKNTYVEKKFKDGDFVVDFDEIRATHPQLSTDQLKVIRNGLEEIAKTWEGDAWVIRCVADAEKRQTLAQSLGAVETVVLETDAETAKARIKERNRNPERNDEVFGAIDEWWSQYGVVASDVIVKPDMGEPSIRQDENKMPKSNNEHGYPDETPVVEMTPEQQAAYWKRQSRKHEGAKKDLETQLAELKDPKNQVNREDLEAEIRADIAKAEVPGAVRSKFKSVIADRLTDEDFDEVFEGLDYTKFLTAEGQPDADLIEKRANLIAPPAVKRVSRRQAPNSHQGPRQRDSKTTVASGRELFDEFSGRKK